MAPELGRGDGGAVLPGPLAPLGPRPPAPPALLADAGEGLGPGPGEGQGEARGQRFERAERATGRGGFGAKEDLSAAGEGDGHGGL